MRAGGYLGRARQGAGATPRGPLPAAAGSGCAPPRTETPSQRTTLSRPPLHTHTQTNKYTYIHTYIHTHSNHHPCVSDAYVCAWGIKSGPRGTRGLGMWLWLCLRLCLRLRARGLERPHAQRAMVCRDSARTSERSRRASRTRKSRIFVSMSRAVCAALSADRHKERERERERERDADVVSHVRASGCTSGTDTAIKERRVNIQAVGLTKAAADAGGGGGGRPCARAARRRRRSSSNSRGSGSGAGSSSLRRGGRRGGRRRRRGDIKRGGAHTRLWHAGGCEGHGRIGSRRNDLVHGRQHLRLRR
jgi:hypothetical protein